MKKKTSLKDIAKALNVSSTLVSMVLNGHSKQHGISSSTQQKVLKKAKELNYQPNSIARGLRTGKTNTIGLIVPDISNAFYAQIAKKIETKASEKGYHLIFCSSNECVKKEEDLIRMLRARQVDGLILASTAKNNSIFKELIDEAFPLVLIDRLVHGLSSNYVVVDNYNSSIQAVERLIHNSHQRIGLLSIGPSHISSIKDREQGYIDALQKNRINIDQSYICAIPFQNVYDSVGTHLSRMLQHSKPVTALYATNNNIAKACLHHLQRMHKRIPEDIALLSYDDIDLFEFCHPPVTAVEQPIDIMGEKGLDILLKLIKGTPQDKPVQQITLAARIVIRTSCGTFNKQ
jgi:LacI family transcriptional regulator